MRSRRGVPLVARLALVLGLGVAGPSEAAGSPHGPWISARPIGNGTEVRLVPGEPVTGTSLLPEGAVVLELETPGRAPRRARLDGADVPVALGLPPGTSVLRFAPEPFRIETGADEFDALLAEEGLDHALLWRTENGLDDLPGVATVSLRAETVVGAPVASPPRREGLAISVSGGDSTIVLVRLDGEPAPGLQVVARTPDGASQRQDGTTDRHGEVRFPLGPGAWILTTAHASETPDDDGAWTLRLTSLAFDVAPVSARR